MSDDYRLGCRQALPHCLSCRRFWYGQIRRWTFMRSSRRRHCWERSERPVWSQRQLVVLTPSEFHVPIHSDRKELVMATVLDISRDAEGGPQSAKKISSKFSTTTTTRYRSISMMTTRMSQTSTLDHGPNSDGSFQMWMTLQLALVLSVGLFRAH